MRQFPLLIVDEAHLLVAPGTRGAKCLAELTGRSTKVLLMTGTPFKNTANDLGSLLNIVAPSEFPEGENLDRKYKLNDKDLGKKKGGIDSVRWKMMPFIERILASDLPSLKLP